MEGDCDLEEVLERMVVCMSLGLVARLKDDASWDKKRCIKRIFLSLGFSLSLLTLLVLEYKSTLGDVSSRNKVAFFVVFALVWTFRGLW